VTRTLQQALEQLYGQERRRDKLGLDGTRALLGALGNPERSFRAIHVAGTNGKGSTCAMIERVLRGNGVRTGLFTSPHLVDFRERIVVDGVPISEQEVVAFVERWTPTVERLGATFFEATTALAFAHFARVGAEVALVETGLGGRLDSTNVVAPLAAGVTSIGFDHMEYLGSTLEAIAAEKAGIFKRGVPAVVGETDAHVRAVLASHAHEAGAGPVRIVSEEVTISERVLGVTGTRFRLRALGEEQVVETPLIGAHQADNFAFTLLLLDAAGDPFRVSLADAVTSARGIRLPGRYHRSGRWIFDVAHNPDGVRTLASSLATVAHDEPVIALVCVLGDKDWRTMLDVLAPVVTRFILTDAPTAPTSRAWQLEEAVAYARARRYAVQGEPNFDEALALAEREAGTIVVTGSFHTVGDAMARLQVSPLTG